MLHANKEPHPPIDLELRSIEHKSLQVVAKPNGLSQVYANSPKTGQSEKFGAVSEKSLRIHLK